MEERARRQGAETARREAAEAVREAEERARQATLAAEEKALRLQVELDALQRKFEEAQAQAAAGAGAASASSHPAAEKAARKAPEVADEEGEEDDPNLDDPEAVEQAVRRVEAATFEELSARQWARRAVNATGVFPVVEPTLLDGVLGDVRTDETGLRWVSSDETGLRWVCIRIPRGAGKSVLMDTPFGRFAVLVPAGLPPGSPLLVPLPAATDDDEVGRKLRLSAEMDAKEQAREAQLLELMGRGVSAQEAAQYCDGVTAVDELAALIASDAAALEAGEEASIEEPQAGSHHARGGSSFCIIS